MKKRFPIQLAKEAILLRDYGYAVELLYPEAVVGNSEAQFLCGYLHFAEPSISKDQAILWLTQVAEQGHPEANYVLACCPDLTPEYTFRSPPDELGWQRLLFAAEHNSAAAQGDLGRFYAEDCLDLSQDLEKSREWRTHAFHLVGKRKSGLVNAEIFYSLGMMILEGIGGPQDLDGLRILYIAGCDYANPYSQKALEAFKEIVQTRKHGISEDTATYLEQKIEELSDLPRSPHVTYKEWQDYIECYIRRSLKYNLVSAPFEDFVGFLFEHIPASSLRHPFFSPYDANWHNIAAVETDPVELVRHYIRLFQNPEFLLDLYHPIELERGFWDIREFNSWSLGAAIHGKVVPIDQAETCIRAMYPLFAKLFAQNPLLMSSFMWWDSEFANFGCPHEVPHRDYDESESQRLHQAMFETLTAILQIDSLDCKAAALHGLGHLQHPHTEKVIKAFLVNHPELADWQEYALAAIEGDIL
ncbi:MAG: sel1 repeat family protein [Chloroflexi bacterium]|nr:sel1 repeat family protein [Chloroflexota bacterium]